MHQEIPNVTYFENDSEYNINIFLGNVCENGTGEQGLLSSTGACTGTGTLQ